MGGVGCLLSYFRFHSHFPSLLSSLTTPQHPPLHGFNPPPTPTCHLPLSFSTHPPLHPHLSLPPLLSFHQAPEVLFESKSYDQRADLFGIGVMFYRMVMGRFVECEMEGCRERLVGWGCFLFCWVFPSPSSPTPPTRLSLLSPSPSPTIILSHPPSQDSHSLIPVFLPCWSLRDSLMVLQPHP